MSKEYIERGALLEILENQGHADIDDVLNIPAADAVELPCVRPFNNGVHGVAYEVLSWHERFGFMTKSFLTEEEAEEELRVIRMEGGADNG